MPFWMFQCTKSSILSPVSHRKQNLQRKTANILTARESASWITDTELTWPKPLLHLTECSRMQAGVPETKCCQWLIIIVELKGAKISYHSCWHALPIKWNEVTLVKPCKCQCKDAAAISKTSFIKAFIWVPLSRMPSKPLYGHAHVCFHVYIWKVYLYIQKTCNKQFTNEFSLCWGQQSPFRVMNISKYPIVFAENTSLWITAKITSASIKSSLL